MKHKWISAAEAADILDTYPDKINYWGEKGMFGNRIKRSKYWKYSRQRVLLAKPNWDALNLSGCKRK